MGTQRAVVSLRASDLAATEDRANERAWLPIVLFLSIGLALVAIVWASNSHLPLDGPVPPADPSTEPVIGGWLQYDSGWYLDIAEHGYTPANVAAFKAGQQSSVAFFPGYPLVVRGVARVSGNNFNVAADLTTAAAGLVAALLFWLWCRDRLGSRARRTALVLLLVYPYAWYLYGTGYGDAFFLAAALGAFVLVDRDHPVLAGLVGVIASLTRATGVPLVAGLLAVQLERRGVLTRGAADSDAVGRWQQERSRWRVDLARLQARDFAVLLAAVGIVAYSLYLWRHVGDLFAYSTVQAAPGWDQPMGPHTWFKIAFFGQVFRGQVTYWVRLIPHALLALVFLVSAPLVARRFGWGYGFYTLAVVALPLAGSATFIGTGRYLLAGFPVFALGGAALADRVRLQQVVVGASALLLAVLSSFFARGYYLS